MNKHQLETIEPIMNNARRPLPVFEAELSSAVNDLGGQYAALEACNEMYSMTLRCEDIEIDFNDSELLCSLGDSLAQHLYMIKHGIESAPSFDPYDESTHGESMYFDECVSDFSLTLDIQKLLKEQKYFTYLCNYKGEGEGRPVLSVTVNHLSQFVDKNSSFYQAQR